MRKRKYVSVCAYKLDSMYVRKREGVCVCVCERERESWSTFFERQLLRLMR